MKRYLVIYSDYDSPVNLIMQEEDYAILNLLEKYHEGFSRLDRDVELEVTDIITNEDDYLDDIYDFYEELFDRYSLNNDVEIISSELDILKERYEVLKAIREV